VDRSLADQVESDQLAKQPRVVQHKLKKDSSGGARYIINDENRLHGKNPEQYLPEQKHRQVNHINRNGHDPSHQLSKKRPVYTTSQRTDNPETQKTTLVMKSKWKHFSARESMSPLSRIKSEFASESLSRVQSELVTDEPILTVNMMNNPEEEMDLNVVSTVSICESIQEV
jgi:hypothetical protein